MKRTVSRPKGNYDNRTMAQTNDTMFATKRNQDKDYKTAGDYFREEIKRYKDAVHM